MGGIELERATPGRLVWMDLLRGIAIVLVLVWHAPAIPALFDWPVPTWLAAVNNAFLPFRMPTLMFLSGLLLPKALAKGWRAYYLGKVRSLIWPYVLWSILFIGQYGSRPPLTSWRAWYAVGYLWFLFFITVYYFVAPLVTKLPAWLSPWLFMLASIPLNAGVEKRLLYFATFFFLGYWFATSQRLRTAASGWVILVAGVVTVVWATASAVWGLELAYRGEFAIFSVCGILFATWLAQRATGRWVRPMAFVGRNSIVYYTSHFPVMTWVVLAAMALSPDRNPALWLLNLAVALVVSTLLALGRHRPWLSWLFEMPRFLTGWIRTDPSPRTRVPESGQASPGSGA